MPIGCVTPSTESFFALSYMSFKCAVDVRVSFYCRPPVSEAEDVEMADATAGNQQPPLFLF